MAKADLEGDGIILHTVRRYTEGVEPQWLIRAKRLHKDLGSYIYALSQSDEMNLPPEVHREAERYVRAFVEGLPAQVEHDRLNAVAWLGIVNMVAVRHESIRPPLDAGQPPAEVACFTYSLHDSEIAVKLAEQLDDVALLLDRWTDATPRRPTKWDVVARLWAKAGGKRYSAATWRRWDPRKKQKLPKGRS